MALTLALQWMHLLIVQGAYDGKYNDLYLFDEVYQIKLLMN